MRLENKHVTRTWLHGQLEPIPTPYMQRQQREEILIAHPKRILNDTNTKIISLESFRLYLIRLQRWLLSTPQALCWVHRDLWRFELTGCGDSASGQRVLCGGKYKITECIRVSWSQPDDNPDIRDCLYGLDADLLWLLSHDPHFFPLREVKFGPPSKKGGNAKYLSTLCLRYLMFVCSASDSSYFTYRSCESSSI